jgi:hypothetical protein
MMMPQILNHNDLTDLVFSELKKQPSCRSIKTVRIERKGVDDWTISDFDLGSEPLPGAGWTLAITEWRLREEFSLAH